MVTAKATPPQRMCIACRKSQDKKELLRFVLAPDGRIVIDYRQHLPGRGTYTCISLDCMALAVKKNSFRRQYSQLSVPVEVADLQQQLQRALEQRISGLVKMARKSGQLLSGSNQVLDAFKKKSPPGLVVLADDITDAMGQKLAGIAQRMKIFSIRLFDKETLGQMLGKDERSVIAVMTGPLATTLLSELHRYELVREN